VVVVLLMLPLLLVVLVVEVVVVVVMLQQHVQALKPPESLTPRSFHCYPHQLWHNGVLVSCLSNSEHRDEARGLFVCSTSSCGPNGVPILKH
jgi:integral membrane sensor domain MASE1